MTDREAKLRAAGLTVRTRIVTDPLPITPTPTASTRPWATC
ncbi:hypothetical protein OHT77_15195 [Streptomyces sp. NBC_00252]|nr:hypothetical protein [Streptomyces sp. NBC_00252]